MVQKLSPTQVPQIDSPFPQGEITESLKVMLTIKSLCLNNFIWEITSPNLNKVYKAIFWRISTPIIILPGEIIFCIGWPMTSSKVQKLECELYNPNVRVCQSFSLRSTMKTQWLSEFVIYVHHEDSSL